METREGACNTILEAFALYEGLVRHAVASHDTGLSKTQEMIVTVLHVTGPLGMSRIAEWLAVSREQVSRAVAELERKSLVQKERDTRNWRVVNIDLTQQGQQLAQEMSDTAVRNISAGLKVLDDAEFSRLVVLSGEASSILESAADRLVKKT